MKSRFDVGVMRLAMEVWDRFVRRERPQEAQIPRLIAAQADFGTQLAKELEGKYCVEADALGGMPDDEDPGAMRAEILEHTVGYFPRAERERIAESLASRDRPPTDAEIEKARFYDARQFLEHLGYSGEDLEVRLSRAADRCEAALDEADPEGLMARGYDIEGNDFTPPTSPIVHAQGAANVGDRDPNEFSPAWLQDQAEKLPEAGRVRIPWGSWHLGSRRWRPNMALKQLPPSDQHRANVTNGYSTDGHWPEPWRSLDMADWCALHPEAECLKVPRETQEETTMDVADLEARGHKLPGPIGAGNRLRRAIRDGAAAQATAPSPTIAGMMGTLGEHADGAAALANRLENVLAKLTGYGTEERDYDGRAIPPSPSTLDRMLAISDRLAHELERIEAATSRLENQVGE